MNSAVDDARACHNCGVSLVGRFCARCGQEDRPLDPALADVAGELVHELSSLDSRVLRSVRRLFFSPGFLTTEHFAGRRVAWVSPVRLYLIFSVAYFAITAFTGATPLDIGFRLTDRGGAAAAQTVESNGVSAEAELQRAGNEALATWVPRAMFVLVPLFAGLVGLVRGDAGRNYPHHVIFSCHVFAAFFGVQALARVIGWVAGGTVEAVVVAISMMYAFGYLVLSLRAVYGGTTGRALAHAMFVLVFFWLATILVAAAIIVPFLWDAFQSS
jgi:hypothetical protein